MTRTHSAREIRGHLFRGSRSKLRTVYLLQGIMWGSAAFPLFTAALFVAVTAYVEHRPLYRVPHT